MNKKPRIAFCFSWQARTLDQTYLFFQRNLFDAAKEQQFDYDVFCAVEDDEDVDKVKLLNPTKVEKIKSSEVEKIIEKKHGEFIRTVFRTKYKWAYYTYEWIVNYLQQLYKVSKSIMLCNDFEQYDIIVRLRFDTIFINQFNFTRIFKDLNMWNTIICNNIDLNIIGIKGVLWKLLKPTWQIQDFFFFGDKKSMKTLSNIFDNFQECFKWFEVKKIFKPIYYLTNWLAKFVLWVNNNSKFHIWSVPLQFWAYTIFVPEKAYFWYFKNHNIQVLKNRISIIILRKDITHSLINLLDKTEYEL